MVVVTLLLVFAAVGAMVGWVQERISPKAPRNGRAA